MLLFSLAACVQQPDPEYVKEIKDFQNELNRSFANPEYSPLTAEDLKTFKHLDFYKINPDFRVKARFIRTADEEVFGMQTTTDRLPLYKKFAEAHFKLKGQKVVLNIYQNQELMNQEAYRTLLFLPFRDKTSGTTSYGGGRYLDLEIPAGDEIILDFNKAYNPYCAYNHNYSCPIPPPQNKIPLAVEAGVMAYH